MSAALPYGAGIATVAGCLIGQRGPGRVRCAARSPDQQREGIAMKAIGHMPQCVCGNKPIVSRDDAWITRKTRFFLGCAAPCSRGHISERQTINGVCSECHRLKTAARKDLLRGDKPKRLLLTDEQRKEKAAAYGKVWRAANKGKASATSIKWKKLNPEQYRLNQASYRHKRRGATGKFTRKHIILIMSLQRKKCAWCRVSISVNYHVDHIMPISLGGTNDPRNLQLLCPQCNQRKHAKHPIQWAQEEGRLI